MDSCFKCGKQFGFFDKINASIPSAQLKEGYLDLSQKSQKTKSRTDDAVDVPEYNGKIVCSECATQLWWSHRFEKRFKDKASQNKSQIVIIDAVQKEEEIGRRVQLISETGETYGYLLKSESHVRAKITDDLHFGHIRDGTRIVGTPYTGSYGQILTLVNEKKQPTNGEGTKRFALELFLL